MTASATGPLIRLVRMTFAPKHLGTFHALFRDAAPQIRSFPGCRRLELWVDAEDPTVLTTYSLWDDADALERYRSSDLFRTTWARTKPLFAERPSAWSHYGVTRLDATRPV